MTGGSAGIGRSVVARLAAAGATVVTCARDEARLRAEAGRLPGIVDPVACDLTDPRQRRDLIEHVVEHHGRLDALVNNAGQGRVGLLTDLDADSIHDVVALNVVAVADLTRLALPHITASHGDVVMISSVAGWLPVPPLSLYSATKAAVDGLVHALRRESPAGLRIHSVNPGPARTEWLLRAAGLRPDDGEGHRGRTFGVPPEHVADAVHRCLTGYWHRTVAVPRWLALTRLASLPPVSSVLDLILAPIAPPVARWTHRYRDSLVARAHSAQHGRVDDSADSMRPESRSGVDGAQRGTPA
ncbi:SDR family oxidoreductase [Kibdelosporangium phytohabitans]|uniref:SDR family oxidoreductase n=1 Tax=Kibdelosporangium phytohabitans TaxID=860235 RepID=UPI0007C853CD|nr:SDR family oxidoreductase [Kibdelosporangium phytohabitans]MBE1468659.1 NAD(P)-dependent dehydrogenase (short-subunit alcohol dehydrogenase family) [Kibdelosporangium phytohabitans]